MRNLIINADDFGMSEAVNLGVIKGVQDGVVSSATIMVNMPKAEHAFRLAKEIPDLFIGLHANFVLGEPCAQPSQIPSIVDQNGCFYRSSDYACGKRYFIYQEIKIELAAQMERFKVLRGHYPEHIEPHAAGGKEIAEVFYSIAKEYGIHTSLDLMLNNSFRSLEGYQKTVIPYQEEQILFYMKYGLQVEDFLEDKFGILEQDPNTVMELHFHPGYLDQFVLEHSSMTSVRCCDLDTLCDSRVSNWLKKNNINCIDFRDLKL